MYIGMTDKMDKNKSKSIRVYIFLIDNSIPAYKHICEFVRICACVCVGIEYYE